MRRILFSFCPYVAVPGIPLPSATQLITMTNVDIIVDVSTMTHFFVSANATEFPRLR